MRRRSSGEGDANTPQVNSSGAIALVSPELGRRNTTQLMVVTTTAISIATVRNSAILAAGLRNSAGGVDLYH